MNTVKNRDVRGFSLLEVVLALAILAGALAALGEVMRLGDQNAGLAADESRAEILAESVMSEILVGARPLANVQDGVLPVEAEPKWIVSIEVRPTEFQELVAVGVTVAQQLPPQLQPARCELVRWMPNPDYLANIAAQQQQAASSGTGSNGATGTAAQGTSGGEP